MRPTIHLLIALFVGGLIAPAAYALPEQVVVGLFKSCKSLPQVWVAGPIDLAAPVNRRLNGTLFRLQASNGQVRVVAQRDTARDGTTVLTASRINLHASGSVTRIGPNPSSLRSYTGTLGVSAHAGELVVANRVPVRDYVKSVVGSETNPNFPVEELKAQSVLAQTMLARYHPSDELPDTTERQVYMGRQAVRAPVSKAVDETWGQTLVYHQSPITVYFHSTCAGGTSDGERYFELTHGSYPYLKGVECQHCRQSPFWNTKTSPIPVPHWERSFTSSDVRVKERDERGRPLSVNVSQTTINGYKFWMQIGQKLGWDKAPGTRYDIMRRGGAMIVKSTGAGHGVGLCQWGASGLARMGRSYLDILAYYFPGTAVEGASRARTIGTKAGGN